MNWLKHHGVAESRLSVENGLKRRCYLQMRPHQTLDPTSALSELDLSALSYKKAQRAIRDPESTQLYLLRDEKQKQDHSELPQIVDHRYEPVVGRYRGLFREELLEKLARVRDTRMRLILGMRNPPISHIIRFRKSIVLSRRNRSEVSSRKV